jgi:5-methylcytosine-specific restriction endonuclease McrA
MNLESYGSSGIKGIVKPYLCKDCGETDPLNFYGKQKIVCKKCHTKNVYAAQKATRARAIEYKGGCCQHCGYDKYHGALQFHHIDPTQKDPKEFSRTKNWERFKAEVDKCVLLCANCHAEEHERIRRGG